MSKKIHIGADGGGTKTAIAAAYSGSTDVIASCEGKSINYNFIGVNTAAENFAEAIKSLNLPGDCEITSIAIGDPSIDDLTPCLMTQEFVDQIRRLLNLSDNTAIHIKSDVYMTLYGLTQGEPGAIMISGTGSMGMAIDENRDIHIVSGWGRVTEDEGSGYYIAVNGIKAALRYFDGIGPETMLLEKVKEHFGLDDIRQIINIFYAEEGKYPDLAPFSKVVSDAAREGDAEALRILNDAADWLIKGTVSLFKRAKLEECNIGIYGSVLTKDRFVNAQFTEAISKAYPKAKIMIPDVKPEIAALKYNIDKEQQQ